MDLQNEKSNGCVLYRSIVEAAEELEKDQALELLLAYAHYGFGDDVDLEKCDKIVRLILKQSIPSLQAAERRRQASINNGKKGKDFGKRGGRPRKNETPQEAYDRRNIETPTKPLETPNNNTTDTLQKPLETPNKPLEKEYEKDKEKEIYTEVSKDNIKENKYKNLPWEEYLKMFIDRHPGYNYDLESSIFVCTYSDTLQKYQQFILDNTNMNIPLDALSFELRYYYATGKTF